MKIQRRQKAPMKIVHVCPYSPARVIGGVAMVVFELSKRQIKAGHEVHIITSDWDKTKRIKIKKEIVDKIHIHYCKHWLKVSDFSTIWPSVYKKLLKLKPDIIHSHVAGHLHSWLALKASRKLKVPLIVMPHCPWESKRSFMGRLANFVSYRFFPTLCYADAIISITPWENQFLLAEGVAQDKIHTIPNGMSSDFFKRITPNKFKEKHSIPNNHKVVLFFGRLNYTKNPLGFLDIAEAVLNKRDDTTFILMGPDEGELTQVEAKIEAMPQTIQDNIRLLPPTRDRNVITEMYQGADVLLMPSVREGNPLCLYESFASGLPVIASNVNGIPYGLMDKVNGFLLKPDNVSGFVKKTNLLLDDKKLRNKMSQENLKKAKAYDWDIITKNTMKVYNEIL